MRSIVCPYRTMVQLDELLDDGQAQSWAMGPTNPPRVSFVERLEDLLFISGRDPRAFIGDGKLQSAFGFPGGDDHFSSFRRMLDRVF